MNNEINTLKTLIINGVAHCNYDTEYDILFLKVIPNSFSIVHAHYGTFTDYEDFLCRRISMIEKVKFNKLAYLNI